MTVTPLNPTGITLFATLRCTAACRDCCFACSPVRGRSMTLEEMKRYVDMCLEAYPDSIKRLDLTGGECMLLGRDVDRIFSYARDRGLRCSMVSNAFWASDYDTALRTLRRLKRSGLRSASFSTGEDHGAFVPWQNVRNASVAAARLGIAAELRVEGRHGRVDIQRELENDPEVVELERKGSLKVSVGAWMKFRKEGALRDVRVPFDSALEKDPCRFLFSRVIINPYGEVYACCGIGVCRIPRMRLGNVNREPVRTIYERAFEDFLKVWLYTDGPQAVLKYVHGRTGGKFRWHTAHNCDICRVIFTDRDIIPLIRDNFFDAAYFPLITYRAIQKARNDEEQ